MPACCLRFRRQKPTGGSMLTSVPMQLPIQGFTLEEYLHYLSWRIEVQMVAKHLHEWKTAGQVDKGKFEGPIRQAVEAANKRAEKFPITDMPNDIVDPVASGHLDLA